MIIQVVKLGEGGQRIHRNFKCYFQKIFLSYNYFKIKVLKIYKILDYAHFYLFFSQWNPIHIKKLDKEKNVSFFILNDQCYQLTRSCENFADTIEQVGSFVYGTRVEKISTPNRRRWILLYSEELFLPVDLGRPFQTSTNEFRDTKSWSSNHINSLIRASQTFPHTSVHSQWLHSCGMVKWQNKMYALGRLIWREFVQHSHSRNICRREFYIVI